jgi:hypothetical protein
MKLENKNILLISNEPWGDIWFSKHNYAFELSKKNIVYFVNPAPRWNFFNIFKQNIKTKNYTEQLIVLNYFNYLPAFNIFLFRLNNYFVSRKIRKYFIKIGIKDIVFWSFDPYRLYDPKSLNSSLSVFHSMDKYLFSHFGERYIYNKVDYIFCVSDSFVEDLKRYNKSVLHIPHGISSDEFVVEGKECLKIDIKQKHYGLFVGNIDTRLDYKLIKDIAAHFNKIEFVFIGKIADETDDSDRAIFDGKTFANISFIGPRHFKELKKYIYNSDFCFAFMYMKMSGNEISHHKIFHYLALGKPVFCNRFTEYKHIDRLLYTGNTFEELKEKMESFFQKQEDPSLMQDRINFARENSFENIFKTIEEYIK